MNNAYIHRAFCDCGQPAVIKVGNAKICETCHKRDSARHNGRLQRQGVGKYYTFYSVSARDMKTA